MSIQKQISTKSVPKKEDEEILVVKRKYLFPKNAWQGLKKVDSNLFAKTILQKKEFLPRSQMETDTSYKQIIPYLVFNYEDKYFLMQRKPQASESRLRNKYTLGIGGHIRQEDIKDEDIASWARREFHEEVSYDGNFEIEQLGILNDDGNDVGKVHAGFVYLLKGDSPVISVKEELKSGDLLSLYECGKYYENMEEWSKIVFDFLAGI